MLRCLRMAKAIALGYSGEQMDIFFNELNTDTVNLRLLWQDKYVIRYQPFGALHCGRKAETISPLYSIMTRDHHVMQTVLATGFEDFAKGPILKVR